MAPKWRLETFTIRDGKEVPVVHDVVTHGGQTNKHRQDMAYAFWQDYREVPILRAERVNTGKKYPYASTRQKERQRPLYRKCPLKKKTCDCNNWQEVKNGNTDLCSIQTLD